jgi:8-hydroxy-5-deazaflavin:NADPH oxidoreductase
VILAEPGCTGRINRVQTIGVFGGTGQQGRGLAARLSAAGQRVVLGSRDAARAVAVAERLGRGVRGADNAQCAREADVVIVAVPWAGHQELLTALRPELVGVIVVNCVNPLGFDDRGAYGLSVPEGSACEQAARLLPDSVVVGAFHHVSAELLLDASQSTVDIDVFVVGDDRAATDQVQALADSIPGMRGIYAGRLRTARHIEGLTANLIAINRRYTTRSGLRLTGGQW